ncbi:MAG: hypothetical protein FJ279_22815 [Planctomycetes bacterium]|nr:hypothetical protein [Planctomycetota bacterium]
MKDDPIVAEVRRVRDELARKFNYDIHAIFQDLRRREGKTVTIEELRAETGQGASYRSAPMGPSCVREDNKM